jgi:hypothetical protein
MHCLCVEKIRIGSKIFLRIFFVPFYRAFCAGLPEGLFSDQKSNFGYILESLAM